MEGNLHAPFLCSSDDSPSYALKTLSGIRELLGRRVSKRWLGMPCYVRQLFADIGNH